MLKLLYLSVSSYWVVAVSPTALRDHGQPGAGVRQGQAKLVHDEGLPGFGRRPAGLQDIERSEGRRECPFPGPFRQHLMGNRGIA